MEIKIELTREEAVKIICDKFQPMFPDKDIDGDIESYGVIRLEVKDKKLESEDK